jgi:hypothetical protein
MPQWLQDGLRKGFREKNIFVIRAHQIAWKKILEHKTKRKGWEWKL